MAAKKKIPAGLSKSNQFNKGSGPGAKTATNSKDTKMHKASGKMLKGVKGKK
jgi:hypothetical protein